MRARAGAPPRTMAHKILAGHCADPALSGDLVEVKVDQVVLARDVLRGFGEALACGLQRSVVELAIAYDGYCVPLCAGGLGPDGASGALRVGAIANELRDHGVMVARAGAGFAASVHLERFSGPARICVTDEPRLASLGGIGMYPLVVSPRQLASALVTGRVWLRPPCSIQVLLSGRLRPFVSARDLSLELLRRGLREVVHRAQSERGAPVVLEFGGSSAHLLSVAERALLASVAPRVGAAAALFVSDERTEVYLRDQRRSKAYRALFADAGAPFDEAWTVDLGGVDPLIADESGAVRAARDLAGRPVSQAVVGGDGGVSLREFLEVAMLLKSKSVPPHVEFLLAAPSRQILEVLASEGALTDLIATGARLVEPDARLVTGSMYVPGDGLLSARTCDTEPNSPLSGHAIVASATSVAYAIATGELGDPRLFKRPVRVTVPRALPTDDVFVLRERRPSDSAKPGKKEKKKEKKSDKAGEESPKRLPLELHARAQEPWRDELSLAVVRVRSAAGGGPHGALQATALACESLDDVQAVIGSLSALPPTVRAVLAADFPLATVTALSGAGIACFRIEPSDVDRLVAHARLVLPVPSVWGESCVASSDFGEARVRVEWQARSMERSWVLEAISRPCAATPSTQRGPR